MRKIFFAMILLLASSVACNIPVAAQDVWISSGGNGSEWYIVDETIEGDASGKFLWINIDNKLVENQAAQIVRWNFTQISPGDGRLANWIYDIDYGNGKIYRAQEVLRGTNAEKILIYCLNRLRI